MSSLEQLKKLIAQTRQSRTSGRRLYAYGDPSRGLEYNKISTGRGVSKKIYDVDIARTPQIVSDDLEFIDVHARAENINKMRNLVDYVSHRVKGR